MSFCGSFINSVEFASAIFYMHAITYPNCSLNTRSDLRNLTSAAISLNVLGQLDWSGRDHIS